MHPIRFSTLLAIGIATHSMAQGSEPTDPAESVDASATRQDSIQSVQADLSETPTSELSLRITPFTLAELEEVTASALERLSSVADELARGLIEKQQAQSNARMGEDDKAALDTSVQRLLAEKSELVTRINILLDATEVKGGDVAQSRAYVKVIADLQPDEPQSQTAEDPDQQPTEELAKALVETRVSEAIGRIRDMPPAHERQDPWTVPVSELELELQPLRQEEIAKYVDAWLVILQRQVRARIRIDIALESSQDSGVRQRLVERQAEQQQVILAVVERVQAALMILQDRGGDIAEYKKYVASASGQKLNLTNFNVLYAQVLAWLKSPDGGVKIGLNILKFLGVLAVAWIFSRFLGKVVRTAVNRMPKASSLLRDFLVGGVRRVALIIGLVVAVGALGVNITPLIAAIGAAGLVIGLALQGTLSNFASGLLILIYRPFDIGDVIDGGGVSGKVEAMNLVSTRILTFDNQVMIVPNNSIWNGVITNVTGRATRRVDLTFGIGYSDDIAKATQILEQTMADHELVLKDPAPVVRVHTLGDNSVNLIARPWTKTSDYWDVYWDLMRRVKDRFDEEEINIPFPQRDLHIAEPIEVRFAPGATFIEPKAPIADSTKEQPVLATNEPGVDVDPED